MERTLFSGACASDHTSDVDNVSPLYRYFERKRICIAVAAFMCNICNSCECRNRNHVADYPLGDYDESYFFFLSFLCNTSVYKRGTVTAFYKTFLQNIFLKIRDHATNSENLNITCIFKNKCYGFVLIIKLILKVLLSKLNFIQLHSK